MTSNEFVVHELSMMGIDVRNYNIQIYDVGLNTILMHGGKHVSRRTAGLAVHCGNRHNIYLLSTLDETRRKGVLAHELGHVWLWEHRSPLRVSQIESEGFCELLAYKIYGVINTLEARLLRRGMLFGRTPVYSEGFRTMKHRAENLGWEAYLSSADGLLHPKKVRTLPRFVIHDITPPPFHIVNTPTRRINIRKPFSIAANPNLVSITVKDAWQDNNHAFIP